MENAADALKIGFAMFVFVTAIAVTFTLVSQAKSTADYVLFYADETNFYEHLESNETNREVAVSEVIPTLYRYYKESIGITVKLRNDASYTTYTFDLNNNETIIEDTNGLEIKLTSEADREENLKRFIEQYLLILPAETKFTEDFVEIPISGIYEIGEDDTELTLVSGGKKVYITYTEQ